MGFSVFEKRLKYYIPFTVKVIPDIKEAKNMNAAELMEKEALLIQKNIPEGSTVVLLDEHGKQMRSVEFASFIQKQMNSGKKDLVFVVGGAFGLAEILKKSANHLIALSHMTFTHQMIRLIFIEQLYRAMTILRNEPYHNE
jgi:23S rRNA (pseudouridine1915-N3)-methyltransferase